MRKKNIIEDTLVRKSQQSIRFNNKEMSAIDNYCKKFKIKNKSKFMREAIITEILRKFDKNYPTLWDEPQLRLF
jgi:nickel-dependent lactate racemase